MRFVEDKIRRVTRLGTYALLVAISGAIAFLGFRHDGSMTVGGYSLIESAHADAPGGDGGGDGGDGGDGSVDDRDGDDDGSGGNGSDGDSDDDGS